MKLITNTYGAREKIDNPVYNQILTEPLDARIYQRLLTELYGRVWAPITNNTYDRVCISMFVAIRIQNT